VTHDLIECPDHLHVVAAAAQLVDDLRCEA
jgi:hypothetical protein